MTEENEKFLDRINPFKKAAKKLTEASHHHNDHGNPVSSMATGIGAAVSGAVGDGLGITAILAPNAAAINSAQKAGFNIANMSYNSDRVINRLEQEGHGSRPELREKFEYFLKDFAAHHRGPDGPMYERVGKVIIGRDGPEYEALESFKKFVYYDGNKKEFENLKDEKLNHPASIKDYSDYKEALGQNPDKAKKVKYTAMQALKDGGSLDEYTEKFKEGSLDEYKKELAESRAERAKSKKEQENSEREEKNNPAPVESEKKKKPKFGGRHHAEASEEIKEQQGSSDMERALAKAEGVDKRGFSMRSDKTTEGVPEGDPNNGMAHKQGQSGQRAV